jgi:hypothetical protein
VRIVNLRVPLVRITILAFPRMGPVTSGRFAPRCCQPLTAALKVDPGTKSVETRSSQGCLQYGMLLPTRLGAEANAPTADARGKSPDGSASARPKRSLPAASHSLPRIREELLECARNRPKVGSRASARQTPSARGLCVERRRTVIDYRRPPGDTRLP